MSDNAAEQLVAFSFPIAWASLSDFPASKAAAPVSKRVIEEERLPAPRVVATPAPTAPTPRVDQWEMVVPKMARPAKPAPLKPEVKPVEKPAASVKVQNLATPEFSLIQNPRWGMSVAAMAGAAGVFFLLVVGALATLVWPPSSASSAPATKPGTVEAGPALPVGIDGWTTMQWPRRMSLLRGSDKLTDFRIEFRGLIAAKALGLAYRVKDANNFHAIKLELATPGRDPVIAFKRYTVANGEALPFTQIPLPGTFRLDTSYKVRLDALGDRYTLWIMDRKVDEWTDSRFTSGSLGFFSERGERADISDEVKVFPLVTTATGAQ
jgi:hypothetical protein